MIGVGVASILLRDRAAQLNVRLLDKAASDSREYASFRHQLGARTRSGAAIGGVFLVLVGLGVALFRP